MSSFKRVLHRAFDIFMSCLFGFALLVALPIIILASPFVVGMWLWFEFKKIVDKGIPVMEDDTRNFLGMS